MKFEKKNAFLVVIDNGACAQYEANKQCIGIQLNAYIPCMCYSFSLH